MGVYGDTLCRVTSLPDARYWAVVGAFIDNETKRRGWTDLNFAFNASLSRATIARLKAGGALGEASLAKIEGALDLPRDLLSYIAVGDEFEIEEATAAKDPDLIRWLRKKFAEADAAHRSAVSIYPAPEAADDAGGPTPEQIFDAAMKNQEPMAARPRKKPKP